MPFRTINGKKVFLEEDKSIVPQHLFNDDRLTKHDDRYFLVQEDMALGTLAVDEFTKKAKDLFELKQNILFSQSSEETSELLDVTGGGKKSSTGGSLELANEKKFLEGLDSAGALEE